MFRVSRPTIFGFFLLLPAVSAHAAPRPFWPVPPLSSFDGARWGDLQLGRTTFKQIQARYETGKGAYTASTELSQPKTVPLRVDLLWNKRGADEVLSAITVRFASSIPRRAEVERLYAPPGEPGENSDATAVAPPGEPAPLEPPIPEIPNAPDVTTEVSAATQAAEPVREPVREPGRAREFFWPGRFENWSVAPLASRGVAIFTLDDGDFEAAPLLLLTRPANLQLIPARLSQQWQPVVERIDPHGNEPRVMEFGTISVSFDKDLELSDFERDRTKDIIKDADADGAIRYVRGARGTYRVTITGNKKRDKGSVSVSVSIAGDGPYGALSGSGNGTDTWKFTVNDDQRDREYRVIDSYRDALRDAMQQAQSSFLKAMNASGLPPLSTIREAQWAQIVEDVRAEDNRAFEPRNPALDGILR